MCAGGWRPGRLCRVDPEQTCPSWIVFCYPIRVPKLIAVNMQTLAIYRALACYPVLMRQGIALYSVSEQFTGQLHSVFALRFAGAKYPVDTVLGVVWRNRVT